MFVICPKCKKVNEVETLTTLGMVVANDKFLNQEVEITCQSCSEEFTVEVNSFIGEVKYL